MKLITKQRAQRTVIIGSTGFALGLGTVLVTILTSYSKADSGCTSKCTDLSRQLAVNQLAMGLIYLSIAIVNIGIVLYLLAVLRSRKSR